MHWHATFAAAQRAEREARKEQEADAEAVRIMGAIVTRARRRSRDFVLPPMLGQMTPDCSSSSSTAASQESSRAASRVASQPASRPLSPARTRAAAASSLAERAMAAREARQEARQRRRSAGELFQRACQDGEADRASSFSKGSEHAAVENASALLHNGSAGMLVLASAEEPPHAPDGVTRPPPPAKASPHRALNPRLTRLSRPLTPMAELSPAAIRANSEA